LKDTKLDPPITYETPIGYSIVLEPIAYFGQMVNRSIFTKFSATKSKDKVYINIDEDLTNKLTNNLSIKYKLKVTNIYNYIIIKIYNLMYFLF